MKPVKGHGLRGEGLAFVQEPAYFGGPSGPRMVFDQKGQGLCHCGAWSPILPTTAARRRWHREHKQAVLDERGPAATCVGCDPPQGFASFEDAQRHARAEGHGRIEVSTEGRKR
jgi:hypothetical protein